MWSRHVSSRTGKVYYFCAATGETRWAKPVIGRVMDAPPPLPSVEQHYDERAIQKRKREDDPDYTSRLYHNAVKAQLIQTCVPKDSRVLDLACGKGGDLHKFMPYVKSYLGMDLSQKSVEEATRRSRYANAENCFKYVHADASTPFSEGQAFDAVSCMFALHYFYKTEDMLQTFLTNVATHLSPGGLFFGIMTDARAVRAGAVRALLQDKSAFGNTLFQVAFDAQLRTCLTAPAEFGYGVPYVFSLQSGVVECEEYCAPMSILERMATRVGLELVAHENLASFKLCPELIQAMRVIPLNAEERELAAMYTTFIFKKKSTYLACS